MASRRVRSPNWDDTETMLLANLRREAFLLGENGSHVWHKISESISGRSAEQCRGRWETLVKMYRHVQGYCTQTGYDHEELDDKELASMRLETAYRRDWYIIVKEVCSGRKRRRGAAPMPSTPVIETLPATPPVTTDSPVEPTSRTLSPCPRHDQGLSSEDTYTFNCFSPRISLPLRYFSENQSPSLEPPSEPPSERHSIFSYRNREDVKYAFSIFSCPIRKDKRYGISDWSGIRSLDLDWSRICFVISEYRSPSQSVSLERLRVPRALRCIGILQLDILLFIDNTLNRFSTFFHFSRGALEWRWTWETLVKGYKHVQYKCTQTGKCDEELGDKDFASMMTLETACRQDWYITFQDVFGQNCDRVAAATVSKGSSTQVMETLPVSLRHVLQQVTILSIHHWTMTLKTTQHFSVQRDIQDFLNHFDQEEIGNLTPHCSLRESNVPLLGLVDDEPERHIIELDQALYSNLDQGLT